MVDDAKDIIETAESKAAADAIDRARLARERREAEQRKRLDELRAHAAAAQAQREKRDEDRRRRQAEQRAKDDDRRLQVEERKRAIWEASVSRREALLQRERDRTERLERARAARSAPRPAFAFGSSTPRLLEPLDSGGFFWAARSTNPIDQMNFFESLAASTTNVMFASVPLVRRASALQLDSDNDNKDEPDRQPAAVPWSSVARRRTDLVPTLPAPRAPGRAYSMTRLDRLPAQRPLHSASPSLHHLNRQPASGETTPGSRPGSALSSAGAVLRRAQPRKPRPASIAGTGVNTPRGIMGDSSGAATGGVSLATTPSVSRDSTVMAADVPRRPSTTPRRPRPHSMHAQQKPALSVAPGEGKPPPHRKPKPSKDHDKPSRNKSLSLSPGRTLSPSPLASKETSVDKEIHKPSAVADKPLSALEVAQKLEALQIQNGDAKPHLDNKLNENKEIIEVKPSKPDTTVEVKPEVNPVQKPVEKIENKNEQPNIEKEHVIEEPPKVVKEQVKVEKDTPKVEKEQVKVEKETPKVEKKEEEKKEPSQEKTDESDMTASMSARRITTEEEAKAALAERRKRAREELERQAELDRQRLQREAEEEAERQRQEEERQRREEEEARELARLQRQHEEEKLRKAIEVQQQLEREEAERKTREEAERIARIKDDEDRRRAAEEAEKARRGEAEREERERLARKQRVEAIMARTRLKKQAEEDKKQQEKAAPAEAVAQPEAPQRAAGDNGNVATGDLLGFATSQSEVPPLPSGAGDAGSGAEKNNGNLTHDLLGLSEQNYTEDKIQEQSTPNKTPIDNQTPALEPNNGNHADIEHIPANVGHISANFIQTERLNESQSKAEKLIEDDFTTHNGHGHNHPLTLQNAI